MLMRTCALDNLQLNELLQAQSSLFTP